MLLGVSWLAATIAAFVIGIALTGTSGPDRPGFPRWQEPGMGAVLVGCGALVLVFVAGAEISVVRDRRRHPNARYRPLRLSRYYTIPQALRHNLWAAPISVALIAVGLWLHHRYG